MQIQDIPFATAFSIRPARLCACILLGSFSNNRPVRHRVISIFVSQIPYCINEERKVQKTNRCISSLRHSWWVCNDPLRGNTSILFSSSVHSGRYLFAHNAAYTSISFSCFEAQETNGYLVERWLERRTHEHWDSLSYFDSIVTLHESPSEIEAALNAHPPFGLLVVVLLDEVRFITTTWAGDSLRVGKARQEERRRRTWLRRTDNSDADRGDWASTAAGVVRRRVGKRAKVDDALTQ